MDDNSGTYESAGKHLQNYRSPLLILKSLIRLLTDLFSLTEEDLMEAGVYLRETRK
jgi:hypothetical protein